jgi:hypothetical protein
MARHILRPKRFQFLPSDLFSCLENIAAIICSEGDLMPLVQLPQTKGIFKAFTIVSTV